MGREVNGLMGIVLSEMFSRGMMTTLEGTKIYLQVVKLFLVRAPDGIVNTIIIGHKSNSLVGISLEAVVWLLQLIACITVDSFRYSLYPYASG